MDCARRRPATPPSSPSQRRNPPDSGFSLVEVLVALTIVGIAASLGLPKMYDVANQNRVHRAAQAIQIEVQQSFAIAGRNRSPVTVRWDAGASELRMTDLAGTTTYRRLSVSGFGLTASDVAVSPAVFTVFPTGFAKDSLVVAISRSTHKRSVHVSRAGMVLVK